MTTTLQIAARVYKAILELMQESLDFNTAYMLILCKQELEPKIQFLAEQEKQLVQKYGYKDDSGQVVFLDNGTFQLEDGNYESFNKAHNELNNVEVELTKRKLKSLPVSIKPSTLEPLLLVFELPEIES